MLLLKNIFRLLLLISFVLITAHCAKMGTISGGPKDMDPPVLLSAEPAPFTTNFKTNKIKLNFDEYIQLKDFNQQFNISPPIKKKPKVWINNKSVVIQLNDTLKDSTTYTLNFGNSLADNNEGNVLENFEYVLSTSNYIDSMGVQGYVLDAFTKQPSKEPFLVCLYSNLSDTAPFKQRPTFTGRTYKDGVFTINNVKNGIYRLYAFQDKNSNLKYDPVEEAFAFADTLVILKPDFLSTLTPPQSILDSLNKKDTAKNDSVKKKIISIDKNKMLTELFTFTEKSKKQFMKDFFWKERRKMVLTFNLPLINNELKIMPIYQKLENWYHIEKGPLNDSIIYWVTDTSLLKIDSLRTALSYIEKIEDKDTIWKTDTVKFLLSEVKAKKKKGKENEVEKMVIKTNATSTIDLDADIYFEPQLPISNFVPEQIELLEKVDTVFQPVKYSIAYDSVFPRRYHLLHKWQEQTSYKLFVYPGCFENIYGIGHDTLQVSFTTQKEEFYGNFTFNISRNDNRPIILQLLNKNQVVYEKYLKGNGSVDFKYLNPGTYTLKAIYDENNDNQFTTGDFLLKKQAEKVTFYKGNIAVRSNWESTIEWSPEF